jgi:hypothetical protein
MVGYQTKSTASEFFEYYAFNQMTVESLTTAIANNDPTGLWATHGTNIKTSWDTIHTYTFDSSTQTLTYIVDWISEDVYDHWQTIKEALDFTDEDFLDIDITHNYFTKTEQVV